MNHVENQPLFISMARVNRQLAEYLPSIVPVIEPMMVQLVDTEAKQRRRGFEPPISVLTMLAKD
jgi:hypothetical protein